MVLRKPRWLAAAVLAAVAAVVSPGRSAAGIVIMVSETDAGGSVIAGTTQTFTIANPSGSFNTGTFNTANFTDLSVSGATSSGSARTANDISSTLAGRTGANFNSDIGLRVEVLDDGFQNANPNSPGNFLGSVTTTGGFAFTSNRGEATLLGTTPELKLGPATATATPSVSGAAGFDSGASPNVSNVPSAFSIQQVINFRVTALSNVSEGGSFTAGISSSLNTSPQVAAVPAPPALLLALAAVPALGLRRVLARKK